MFCEKRYPQKFRKTDKKKPVSEFLLQVLGQQLKDTSSQVFSCQFCEIVRNTFFIEHLRWLFLPILKLLDSQRQWCKWISKLVKVYFFSTSFLVLVGIFVFIFGELKLSFYISAALWLRKYDVFDHTIEVSRDFLDAAPSSCVSTLPSFGDHGPCECGDKTFLICHLTMWSMCHVTLLVVVPLS